MTVSNNFLTSAFASETGEVWLVLLEINHADLATPIRVVNNTEHITSNGDDYVGFPFDIILPDEKQDAPPRARLTIDNVSREVAQALRSISSAPSVVIKIINADDPDTIEKSWSHFKLRNVEWTALTVSGELSLIDFTSEPYPAGTFSPAYFPGIF